MSVDAAAAILALLSADPDLTTFDGIVPLDAAGKLPGRPYVVMWSPPVPGASLDSLAGRSGRWDHIVTTTVVGDTSGSVGVAARRVRAAVLDVVPAVTGRASFPIRLDGEPTPIRPDEDVQPPVLYSVMRWLCSSLPS